MLGTKERERTRIRWGSSVNPHAVIVPSSVAWLMERKAKQARTLAALKTIVRVSVALGMLALLMVQVQPAKALQAPSVPPSEKVCGSSILNGPSSAPGGSTTVAAGDNSGVNWNQPGVTFWFAAGDHTIGSGAFNAIAPGNNETFIGAPGAIIDGQFLNRYAFVGLSSGITIEYLTIEDFAPPVNEGAVDHDAPSGWTIEYDTIQDNIPGTGAYLGSNSVMDYNCITANGQQGFGTATNNDVGPITNGAYNVQVNYNEISFNNTCNVEGYSPFPITPPSQCGGVTIPGCGCTGGGKFWTTYNSQFIGNYVHDNYNAGVWYDTNNAVSDIENNYFADNLAWGIAYEISYNARIVNNIFVGNSSYIGKEFAPLILPAVFISNSGSDPRLGAYGSQFLISGNLFYNNWGGVTLWQDSDRFCADPSLPNGPCTITGQASISTCGENPSPVPSVPPVRAPIPPGRRTTGTGGTAQGQQFLRLITIKPYYDDCQWKTANVAVQNNIFYLDPTQVSGCTLANDCGINGLYSEDGIFSPYAGLVIPDNVTFSQANLFSGNAYCGNSWIFDAHTQGNIQNWAGWTGAPYNQDSGSTQNGASCYQPVPPPPPGPVNRTITIPIRIGGGSR